MGLLSAVLLCLPGHRKITEEHNERIKVTSITLENGQGAILLTHSLSSPVRSFEVTTSTIVTSAELASPPSHEAQPGVEFERAATAMLEMPQARVSSGSLEEASSGVALTVAHEAPFMQTDARKPQFLKKLPEPLVNPTIRSKALQRQRSMDSMLRLEVDRSWPERTDALDSLFAGGEAN